jgi:hypothetical protein
MGTVTPLAPPALEHNDDVQIHMSTIFIKPDMPLVIHWNIVDES